MEEDLDKTTKTYAAVELWTSRNIALFPTNTKTTTKQSCLQHKMHQPQVVWYDLFDLSL
jgi:hypothetical protein